MHGPFRTCLPIIICIVLATAANLATARIPEPDNVIYGSVTYNNSPVTSADIDITVRLELFGNEIVSYPMGSEAISDLYVLRVPVDVLDPREPNTARPGESVNVFITKGAVNILAGTFVIGERGTAQNQDIGAFNDTDLDGMPDEWEVQFGLNPNDPSDAGEDLDGDGDTNLQEFLSGTDPTVFPGVESINVPIMPWFMQLILASIMVLLTKVRRRFVHFKFPRDRRN